MEGERKAYLYVTPTFPSPEIWRGAYSLDFVKALRDEGRYRVEVFVPGDGGDYEIEGVIVHRFKERRLPSAIFPFLFSHANVCSFLRAVENAGVDVEDVAVCHANTAAYACYAVGLKERNCAALAVLHHHCLGSFGLNMGVLRHVWLYNMVQFPILRRYHERIDLHLFVSDAARRSFLSAPDASWTEDRDYRAQMRFLPYRPVRVGKTYVLHNGVDREVFRPAQSVEESGKGKEGPFVIGCVGNFLPTKGQMTLLEAVVELGNGEWGTGNGEVKVIFVGSGKERGKCERYARENGINAEFWDEVRHEALPDFYRSIDLLVLPSTFEGFGCVYTEAWACGVPFIGVKGQGIAEITADDWLVEPGNVADLAKKIRNVVEGKRNQTLTGEIDIKKLVKGYVEEIEA